MDDPYDVLGVKPDADEAELDQAYRRRVVETHPDQGGSVRAFQRVKAAYEAVMNDRDESAPDADAAADTEADEASDERRDIVSRVEYLDYEVIQDRGWSLDDDDLFEKASTAGLDPTAYGKFLINPGETLLEAAENRGFAWPYACRGGACANCAVAVVDGEMATPVDHILPAEMVDRGIRLSCIGAPTTETLQVVYNVKGLPDLDELKLPPYRFERARSTD
ncbi:ferredoxin Fer [Haloplanus sp.]|uniref:ferredoxin Fer n=1 Tax=Haloplanus sp. TaxID=1961696 RepID=UPI002629D47D|nr:ferredoxin Fer [Haloplanus sp.]